MNKFIITICLCCCYLWASAQQPQPGQDETLDPENIDIVKPYEPVLADAIRLEFAPDLPSPDELKRKKPNFGDYYVPNRLINNMAYYPTQLKPLAYRGDRRVSGDGALHNIWLKAGFGNLSTPLLDVGISTGKSREYIAGLTGSYISSNGEIEFQDYNKTDIEAYGKIFNDVFYTAFDAGYQRNQHYLYGYDHSVVNPFEKSQLERLYNTISASAEIGNSIENRASTDYKGKLGYSFHFTPNDAKEHNIILDSYVSKRSGENLAFGAEIFSHFSTYTADSSSTANSDLLLNAIPQFTYKSHRAKLTLGANAMLDHDEFSGFPYINLEGYILPEKLTLYGGWNKKLVKNNFQKFSTENPFIIQNVALSNSQREDRYVGAKGEVNGIFYNVKVYQQITDNQPLYVNLADLDTMMMTVVYDSTMTTFGGLIEASYAFSEQFKAGIGATFNNYNTETVNSAWHLPTLELNVRAEFMPIPQLSLIGDFFLLQGAEGRLSNGRTKDLKGAADLNFAAKYTLMKNISVFVNLNNVLSVKTERYLNYPTYGFNVVGGAIVRF